MFMLIGEGKRCPTCGVKGKNWNKKTEVFHCPSCKSVFSEFGIIVEPQEDKEVAFG